jgi:hypothetical protein
VVAVEDLVQRTGDGQTLVGYSVAGRSGDWMTLCAIYTVHEETKSMSFFVWPRNQGRRFVGGLSSKPLGYVSRFGSQNWQLRFGNLGIKITVMVSWFVPQNQVGYGLSVTPKNRQEDEDGVGHALRSSGLLHLKASRARVSQFGLKTGGGVARWCTWHHRGGCVELKLKTDGLMRWSALDPSTLTLSFSMY